MILDPRNPKLSPDQHISGYRVIRSAEIRSIQSVFHELEHIRTGARHIHISTNDDNNMFMVLFRTLPTNSTGVAHILEHAVLEGSRRYPVKTFKHLQGRSINTFLNAMTGYDYTGYPYASRNRKDFNNLLDLYLDAVFFPLLEKEMFLQEGWRYEFDQFDDPATPLRYKGVVYNEMKGALGNPMRLFHEFVSQAVFPNLVYGNISGGDPREIPLLSFEDWKAFHARHYHPSNAWFLTYGSFPLDETLHHIDSRVLTQFERISPPDAPGCQPPFDSPRRINRTFPTPSNDDPIGKSFAALIWKLAPVNDFYLHLKFSLLNQILCGDNSARLTSTLLSSGLGGGPAPIGYEASYSESIFGTGLKDTDPDKVDQIEALILQTLEQIAVEGISTEEIDAALHLLEFSTREIRGDRGTPFGLILGMRGFPFWFNGGDFLDALTIDVYLDRLRQDVYSPGFFSTLIRKYLLDNSQRVTLVVKPDQGGIERQEAQVNEHLDAIRAGMTDADVQAIVEQSRVLAEHQDREEDTSCMPSIDIADIARDPDELPQEASLIRNRPLYRHLQPTNGISYLTLHFAMPPSAKPVSLGDPCLGMLTEMGAGGMDHVAMSRRLNLYTGGIGVRLMPYRVMNEASLKTALVVTSKCLPRNHGSMMDLLNDLLFKPDFADFQRFQELLNMQKAYALPIAVFNAHRLAAIAATRFISPLKCAQHNLDGLGSIAALLAFQPDETPIILQSMADTLNRALAQANLTIGITGNLTEMDDLTRSLNRLFDTLPTTPRAAAESGLGCTMKPVREAWIMNTKVSYVAKAFPAALNEHPDAPVLYVLTQLLDTPLYDRVRAKGGAYGVNASYDADAGAFAFSSYRDPHTAQTLESYDEVLQEIGQGRFTDQALEHAIIEMIRLFDVPSSPKEKGNEAFFQTLRGRTWEMRKRFREGILDTTRSDIDRVMKTYFHSNATSSISIVTSDEMLSGPESASLNLTRYSLL